MEDLFHHFPSPQANLLLYDSPIDCTLYHPQLSYAFKIKDNMTAGHTKLLLA